MLNGLIFNWKRITDDDGYGSVIDCSSGVIVAYPFTLGEVTDDGLRAYLLGNHTIELDSICELNPEENPKPEHVTFIINNKYGVYVADEIQRRFATPLDGVAVDTVMVLHFAPPRSLMDVPSSSQKSRKQAAKEHAHAAAIHRAACTVHEHVARAHEAVVEKLKSVSVSDKVAAPAATEKGVVKKKNSSGKKRTKNIS